MTEHWKFIPSQPDLIASSYGRVMVVPHRREMPHGGYGSCGGKPTFGQWDGSRYIYPRRGHKTLKVARLICEAFHGKPWLGAIAMHRDENARNNKADNVVWATQKDNLNCPKFIAYCKSRTGENNPLVKGRRKRAKQGTESGSAAVLPGVAER